MTGLSTTDRALLGILLSVFAVTFSLHLREAMRSGLAHPPVFAAPGVDADPYPRVGGVRLERGMDWSDLQAGDRLIRVGDVDLRGVGYFGFDTIALEQAGGDRATSVVFERDGVRREGTLRLVSYAIPLARVPFLLSYVVLATLVLLRTPPSTQSRLFFAAFVSFAIFQAPFQSPSRVQTYAYLCIFNFGGTIAIGLMLLWLIGFPREVDPSKRLSRRWALLAALHLLARINYISGGPIPGVSADKLALAGDVFFFFAGTAILRWNYHHSSPIGRRRLRWFLYGGYFGTLPLVFAMLTPLVGPSSWAPLFPKLFPFGTLAIVLIPLSASIAIARYNLFDIDRLISRTASYSAALVVGLAAIVLLVPPAAAAIANATGSSAPTIRIVLSMSLVLLFVILEGRLRPIIDHWLYPERFASERGVQQLLQDLTRCRLPEEVTKLVSERLVAILGLSGGRVWTRDPRGWTCDDPRETRLADGALAELLEHDPVPLARDPTGRMARALQLERREALAALDAEVAVPLRCGKDLLAIVALGPKRSGDIYTPADMAHLAAVAAKASEELLRLHDAEIIRLERLRADEQRALRDAAEQADQAKSRFLAAASHDLRQPLHALGLFAGRLVERVEGDSLRDLAENIQGSTAALTEMLDAILDLSRLDMGAITPNLQTFELDPLLARLVGELEETAREKGLALRWEATHAVVQSDPILLGRILRNLLTNAVRYTDQGSIVIGGELNGEAIAVRVSDTGPGIPAEKRQEIFREFVQLDAGRSAGGLGLGLSIVDRLCRLLRHPLSVASVPGHGSVFTVSLPLGVRTLQQPTPLIDPPRLTGRLMVVIDDDLAILGATRDTLEDWGCDAIAAANVEEAIESLHLHRRSPDAIVADYRLSGGRTGIEAIQELRERLGAPVPALVVSGEADPGRQAAIRSAGFRFLQKPLPPSKLRAALLELLRQ